MDVDEIVKDCETDSEVEECDEGSIMEAETMSELTELVDDEELPSGGRQFTLPMNHKVTRRTPSMFKQNMSSQSSAAVAKINVALSANKLLDEKLERLERVLLSRLNECRQKLKVVQSSDGTQNDKHEIFRYVSCGRPYFKDRQNFPAPDNEDAKMAKSQMYDFSLVLSAPGWTVRDKSQLVTLIHKISIDIKKKQLHDQITNLQRTNEPSKDLDKQIMAIRKEIDKVSKLPLSKVALPIDEEYDWEMISNKLNRRHTAHEYQALWKLFFHPSINKNGWGTEEHTKLQKIALQNRKQNWDKIAHELNSGRTGYQCFVYFRTNMNNSFTGAKWTPEEITYLKRLIEYYKEHNYIPWGKIAAAMENRTKIQIYNKYMRLVEQRKGRFLPEEDAVILNCVERFGTNFRRMTSFLPGRSMVQIRARYQVLSKMRVSTVWTVEDDKKLVQLMSNPDSNINFSTATQFFPGRNRIKIRSRYVTLVKWMKKHPHLGLEHAPRRGARRLNHGQASENLNEAVENLKNSLISSVQNRAKRKKLTEESTHKDLNDAIVVLLVNCIVKEKEAESKRSNPDDHLVLGPDHVVSFADLNMTNLRKNIIFLNACLDEASYMESDYREDYPTLGDSSQDVSLVKVKSYSRKASKQPIMITDPPNVWGTPSLFQGTRMYNTPSQRNYVLPPQLATITGARAIMSCLMANGPYTESVNLQVLWRRNILLKECLEQALERFYVLFTWPLILSNEVPSETIVSNEPRINSVFSRPPTLPTAPEVTINVKCIKKFKNKDVTEKIDLDEESARKVVIAVEEKIDTCTDEKIEKLLF